MDAEEEWGASGILTPTPFPRREGGVSRRNIRGFGERHSMQIESPLPSEGRGWALGLPAPLLRSRELRVAVTPVQ